MSFSSLWINEQYRNTILGFKVKEVLYREKSKYQEVLIADTEDWGRILMLDGCMMVTEKDEFFYHETIVHLPMALLKAPKSVLVIGGGDGGTLRELGKYSSLEKMVLAEIDALVIDACKTHMPFVGCGFEDARVETVVQDANLYLQDTPADKFDLIICDGSDPVDFAEILIATDFYEEIKRILKPDGIFITQSSSPLSQADEQRKTWDNLGKVFEHRKCAWSLVPVYPGAAWSYMLASKEAFPHSQINSSVPANTRFWKPEFLPALLSEPAFLTANLHG